MRPHKQRAWNSDIKVMITAEEMMHEDSVYMYLNEDNDYIWMRTTGYFDKNGKEIYEGDIFDNGKYIEIVDLEMFYWRVGALGMDPNMQEILGNIHENPEVMERAA